MEIEKIKSKIQNSGYEYSDCLLNTISNIWGWKLEGVIENLVRKINFLPWNYFLYGGEDWEVSTEEHYFYNLEKDTTDFYIDVFCGRDFQLPTKLYLEILNEILLNETEDIYKKKYKKLYKGEFKNGLKHGLWEYYAYNGILMAKGEYHLGQKIKKWYEYEWSKYNNVIEIKDYKFHLNGVPFFEVIYSNNNPEIKIYYSENSEIRTIAYNNNKVKSTKYIHDKEGGFLKYEYLQNQNICEILTNDNGLIINDVFHTETNQLKYKKIFDKVRKYLTIIEYDLQGKILKQHNRLC